MGGSNGNTLSLQERMMSATIGSLLTSVILTPMDVVRIRLQQQQMIEDCGCADIENLPEGKTIGIRRNTSELLKNSRVIKRSELEPAKIFWESSCFQNLSCRNQKFDGTLEAFSKIAKFEGVSTLWRGISITLLMAIPANIVYFTGYEYVRDKSPISKTHPIINPLICGALARVLAATTVAPLELIKTKLQSIPSSARSHGTLIMYKDLLNGIKNEIRVNGVTQTLWKGLEITLWRDVPFSAIYWASYEFYKKKVSYLSPDSMDKDGNSNWFYFTNSFLGGFVSGSIAAVATHPFDVGKTRQQIALVSENPNSRMKYGKSNTMFGFLNSIRRVEGYGALYTGLAPRVAKIAPSCAIMISSYELTKRLFI
ncbi:Mitochondrial carrier protein MTM1 [Nakaseomyces bracarensis]|uniref:Mitochondrial carrier protein MTM1 n=1 Tax=Nakaseomyces bracarensis TaxID=273131 RepID=A0ABR4NR70_9SACH